MPGGGAAEGHPFPQSTALDIARQRRRRRELAVAMGRSSLLGSQRGDYYKISHLVEDPRHGVRQTTCGENPFAFPYGQNTRAMLRTLALWSKSSAERRR